MRCLPPTVSRRRMHHGHHSGVHASPLRWALLSREAMTGNGHTILFANYCVLRNLETSHVVEVIGLWRKVGLGSWRGGKKLWVQAKGDHIWKTWIIFSLDMELCCQPKPTTHPTVGTVSELAQEALWSVAYASFGFLYSEWLRGLVHVQIWRWMAFPETRASSSCLVFHSVQESVITSWHITRRISKLSSTHCFLISPKFGLS